MTDDFVDGAPLGGFVSDPAETSGPGYHGWEQVRDVPASCACWWEYAPGAACWERVRMVAGCPWHGRNAA